MTRPSCSPSMRTSRRSSSGIAWRAEALVDVKSWAPANSGRSLRVRGAFRRGPRVVRVFERVEQRRERRLDDVARAADGRPSLRPLAGFDQHTRRRGRAGRAIEDAHLVVVKAHTTQPGKLRA